MVSHWLTRQGSKLTSRNSVPLIKKITPRDRRVFITTRSRLLSKGENEKEMGVGKRYGPVRMDGQQKTGHILP
ncbi:hypothetical protein Bpfe_030335, partial [Biomphalaria pfeifferi]